MSVLTLAAISVQRGGRRLLHEVTLSVQPGEIVGVVGASGAGKSTLMHVALGLESPTEGCVYWGDVAVTHDPAPRVRAARRRLGAVFQHPAASLDPRRTLLQSLSEPLQAHEAEAADTFPERVADMLEQVGLPRHYASRRPSQLSGGEAQRAAIGRALMLRPSLCVMDEPTSALDPRSVLALMSEVRRLNEALGSAFLLVSHDLAAIAAVASRLVVLEQGCIVEMGAIEGCFAAPQSAALRTLIDASGLALGE